MLGPVPSAHARKRAETLGDRHVTLTKSAALYAPRRKKMRLWPDMMGMRDATVTDTLPTRMQIIQINLLFSVFQPPLLEATEPFIPG